MLPDCNYGSSPASAFVLLSCACAHAALLSSKTDFLGVYVGYMSIPIESVPMEWNTPNFPSKYKLLATSPLEHNTEAKSHLSPFLKNN